MSDAHSSQSWQRCMEQLAALLNQENPAVQFDEKRRPIAQQPLTFQQAFHHCAALYVNYLQLFRALEDVYDGMVQPQKRRAIRETLALTMARVCQLRQSLLLYSSSQSSALSMPDHCHLDYFLSSARLSVRALEVPIPRYFRDQHDSDDSERKTRDLIESLLEEQAVAWGQSTSANAITDELAAKLARMNRLTKEQAIRVIAKNERGRQGAMRAKLMKELRREDTRKKRAETGHALGINEAATRIQAAWRGYAERKRIRKEEQEELIFIGMRPQPHATHVRASVAHVHNGSNPLLRYDPLLKREQIRAQRQTRQLDAALHFADSLASLEAAVTLEDGDSMKDLLWQERYEWFMAEREKTGKFPESLGQFYIDRYPGSEEAKASAAASASAKDESKAKGKKGKGKGRDKAAAAATVPTLPVAAKGSAKNGKGAAAGKAPDEGAANVRDPNSVLLGPPPLVRALASCVSEYERVWLGRDERADPDESFDADLAKSSLRPLIEARIRRSVDHRLGVYFQQIQSKLEAKSSEAKKDAKKGKGKKDKKAKPAKVEESKEQTTEQPPTDDAVQSEATSRFTTVEGGDSNLTRPAGPGVAGRAPTLSKCCEGEKLCAAMPLQDCIALLVKMNILQSLHVTHYPYPLHGQHSRPPPASTLSMAAFQGDFNPVSSQQSNALPNVYCPPSNHHLRAFFTEHFILPQGSEFVRKQIRPALRSLLLLGAHGSGKTLVSRIIAKESGSVWLDCSAGNIEPKLGTKGEIAKLAHLIFAVAQQCQPAVIYLDQCDKFFAPNKAKKASAEMAKFKQLVLAHIEQLQPDDRVLVIGCSRAPHNEAVEQKELLALFGPRAGGKLVLLPPPDYHTRIKLWRFFIEQAGLSLDAQPHTQRTVAQPVPLDLCLLAQLSEGFSVGSIEQAVLATLPPRRVAKLAELGLSISHHELVNALAQTDYVYKGELAADITFVESVTNGSKDRRKLREQADVAQRGSEQADKDAKAAGKKKKK